MEREMRTKIVGVSWEKRQDDVKELVENQELFVMHEVDNPFDPRALAAFADAAHTKKIGYLGKELAHDMFEQMKIGWTYQYFVTQVTGGDKNHQTRGVNIKIVARKEE